jgi:hypothetical protein
MELADLCARVRVGDFPKMPPDAVDLTIGGCPTRQWLRSLKRESGAPTPLKRIAGLARLWPSCRQSHRTNRLYGHRAASVDGDTTPFCGPSIEIEGGQGHVRTQSNPEQQRGRVPGQQEARPEPAECVDAPLVGGSQLEADFGTAASARQGGTDPSP